MPDRTPHRLYYQSTYTYPVSENVVREVVRQAQRLRELTGEPFSFDAACVSYMLDTDRGRPAKSKSDYARIWGWTWQILRDRWEIIMQEVALMRGAYGRLDAKNQTRTKREPTKNQESADSDSDSANSNQGRTKEEPTKNQHTKATPTPTPERKDRMGASAPNRPESVEQVEACFREKGHKNPGEAAAAWWDFFTSNGFRIGKGGHPMVNWKAAVGTWMRNESKFNPKPYTNGHGRPEKPAPARPRSDEEIRAAFEAELARTEGGAGYTP